MSEAACGCEAEKLFLDMQSGDVERISADTQRLETVVGYRSQMEIEVGVCRVVQGVFPNVRSPFESVMEFNGDFSPNHWGAR